MDYTPKLPIESNEFRFAVGDPRGLTSNSWRVWADGAADVYIACRDNFKEAKVSLHTSGRWRMGFQEQALAANPDLVPPQQNRAWDVWDAQPDDLPSSKTAFRLLFPTAELAVEPHQRTGKAWGARKNILYIDAAPLGEMVVVSLLISTAKIENFKGEASPVLHLASFSLSDGRFAYVLAHHATVGDLPTELDRGVAEGSRQAAEAGKCIPAAAYFYFLLLNRDRVRSLCGARMRPAARR